MREILMMIMAFLTGIILGTLFFGGLWFTVKKAVLAKIPAIWFFVSLFLRLSITLIGFYYISRGSWQRLLICVFGFAAARFIVIHLTKLIDDKQLQLKKRISHEA
jgi:F1F0 ATPase subunit 2